jgi:hypothetical protein
MAHNKTINSGKERFFFSKKFQFPFFILNFYLPRFLCSFLPRAGSTALKKERKNGSIKIK